MKILLIADPDSFWTREFIDKVLLPAQNEVFLQSDPDSGAKFGDYYRQSGVRFFAPYRLSSLIMKIPKIRVLYREFKKKRALKASKESFDRIVVFFVTPFALECACIKSGSEVPVAAAFIGSDMLRADPAASKKLSLLLGKCGAFAVFGSDQIAASFDTKITALAPVKRRTVHFGITPLGYIDKWLDAGIVTCKEKFGLDPGKISVCVGYNASSAQQHKEVISRLAILPDEVKKKICVLVPAAYGGSKDYIASVRQALEDSGLDFVVSEEFLDPENVAALRAATDIFINAQTTDSFSASLIECFCAGSRVVTASWLTYREFSQWKLDYVSFSDFDELCGIIEKLTEDYQRTGLSAKEQLLSHCTWDACRGAWNEILTEI